MNMRNLFFDFSFLVYVPAYSPKIRQFLNLLLWGGAHGIPIGFISMTP